MLFYRLEEVLEALLSTFQGTELWDSVPSAIPLFEIIIGNTVKSMRAENGENSESVLRVLIVYTARRNKAD